MKDLNENIVAVKSMDFAVRCVKLAKFLRENYHEYDLASQILKSGTSIGANVREALRGQSRADFRAKMNISLREANETQYWIELLRRVGYLSEGEHQSIFNDCTSLCKLLMSIVKSTSQSIENDKNKKPINNK
ncbi:MAG: four helix bundle protein [Prevotella sp.]|nr:four helix bundle protein [Prevotella sp.]